MNILKYPYISLSLSRSVSVSFSGFVSVKMCAFNHEFRSTLWHNLLPLMSSCLLTEFFFLLFERKTYFIRNERNEKKNLMNFLFLSVSKMKVDFNQNDIIPKIKIEAKNFFFGKNELNKVWRKTPETLSTKKRKHSHLRKFNKMLSTTETVT